MSMSKGRIIIDLRNKDRSKVPERYPERRTGKFLINYYSMRKELGANELAIFDPEAHYVYDNKGMLLKWIDEQVLKKRLEYLV